MTVIDLSEQLEDICRRYPEYWRSREAQRELQALWGGADCNDCGVFERGVRIGLGHWGGMRVRCASGWHTDVPPGLDDPVKGRTVDDEILDDREGGRPPRFDVDHVPVVERAQVQLAGRGLLRSVRSAVDHDPA